MVSWKVPLSKIPRITQHLFATLERYPIYKYKVMVIYANFCISSLDSPQICCKNTYRLVEELQHLNSL